MKKISIGKEKIKEWCGNIKECIVVDKLNAVEWMFLGVILAFILGTLFYDDNAGMFLNYFWINDNALHGKNINFLGNSQLSYGIIQQYFCELWCLPVNIIYIIHSFTVHTAAALIWYKFSMAFIFTLCMREMIKLGRIFDISTERIKWMLILFCSTILVALPVFHIAQTDILYSYLVLVSLRYFYEDNWKRFIIFGAMAVSCKGIALVVLIPLVLLREKRIIPIIRDAILMVSIFVGERVWYRVVAVINTAIFAKPNTTETVMTAVEENSTVAKSGYDIVSAGLIPHFYHKALFFEFGAIRKGYTASVIVVLFVLLCIWCYVQIKEDTYVFRQKCIYSTVVAWMIFFVYASPSPYWIVAMYPFVFLLMFMNYDRIRINILLETGFTFTMFLVYLIDTFWVYGGANNLDLLLLKGLLPEGHVSTTDGPYVARYLNNLGIGSFMNVITAVCLACAIGLIVVNYYKTNVKEELEPKYEKTLMHGFTIFQIGFLYVWYAVVVFVVSRW